MTERKHAPGTRYDGMGLNFGGKRVNALTKRLKLMEERRAAGLDPFTGKRPPMPTNPGAPKK